MKWLAEFRHWLRLANVDLDGIAITIHVKRYRDAHAISAAVSQEIAENGRVPTPYPMGLRFTFMGIPVDIKPDDLQRDLELRR